MAGVLGNSPVSNVPAKERRRYLDFGAGEKIMKPYKSALEIICSNIAYERKHPDMWGPIISEAPPVQSMRHSEPRCSTEAPLQSPNPLQSPEEPQATHS